MKITKWVLPVLLSAMATACTSPVAPASSPSNAVPTRAPAKEISIEQWSERTDEFSQLLNSLEIEDSAYARKLVGVYDQYLVWHDQHRAQECFAAPYYNYRFTAAELRNLYEKVDQAIAAGDVDLYEELGEREVVLTEELLQHYSDGLALCGVQP